MAGDGDGCASGPRAGGCVESGQALSREPKRSRGPRARSYKPSASRDYVPQGPPARPHCTSAHPGREPECACARASPGGSGSDKARWAAGRVVQGALSGGGRRGGAERRRWRREQSCSAVRGDARSQRAELDGPLAASSPLPAAVLLLLLGSRLASVWRHRAASSARSPEARGAPLQPRE